jgi:hypothetical protein
MVVVLVKVFIFFFVCVQPGAGLFLCPTSQTKKNPQKKNRYTMQEDEDATHESAERR